MSLRLLPLRNSTLVWELLLRDLHFYFFALFFFFYSTNDNESINRVDTSVSLELFKHVHFFSTHQHTTRSLEKNFYIRYLVRIKRFYNMMGMNVASVSSWRECLKTVPFASFIERVTILVKWSSLLFKTCYICINSSWVK